jgi:hypothetical protein
MSLVKNIDENINSRHIVIVRTIDNIEFNYISFLMSTIDNAN